MPKTELIRIYSNKMSELDKLRGTGYWDFHYECLWHSYYKRWKELQELKYAPNNSQC